MKKILHYIALPFACLCAVASGAINTVSQEDATVRIIREDDLAEAIAQKKLPRSYTGAIISDKGFVFTSLDAARNKNNELDANVTDNRYIVLFTEREKTQQRVVRVLAHSGLSHFRSEENNLLAIKLPMYDLPSPLIIDTKIIENTDVGTELRGVSYPVADKAQINNNEEMRNSVLKDLQALKEQLRTDGRASSISEDQQGNHGSLFNYMLPYISIGKIESVSNQIGGGTAMTVGVKVSEGSEGMVLVDKSTGKIKGMAVRVEKDSNGSVSKALRNDTLLNFASNNKLKLPSELPWLWIGVGGGVILLLLILLIVLLGSPQKTHTRDIPILKLSGEDGVKYSVTSRELQHGVLLGRSSAAQKRFTKSTVSGKHASLNGLNGKVVIIDQESKGGTYINDERLEPGVPRKVHDGDIIRLADYKVKVSVVSSKH